MVRDILDKQEEEKPVDDGLKLKEEAPKIKMGRIGNKKKDDKGQVGTNNASNQQQDRVEIAVESIEDVEALRKAIQNLCQYTNPLGRLMEQFLEDVPNLEKE
mmetsp:Transcript_33637/g.28426  ORF Transcript_33637/g.28426 Transcript_33637/m.28426 type:complete len:102 (+) Transcript_33637:718-1023(+)